MQVGDGGWVQGQGQVEAMGPRDVRSVERRWWDLGQVRVAGVVGVMALGRKGGCAWRRQSHGVRLDVQGCGQVLGTGRERRHRCR